MKKYIFLLIACFYLNHTSAQTPNPIINTVGIHYSLNGTGDLDGFDISVAKRKKLNSFFDLFYGADLSFHSGEDNSLSSVSRNTSTNLRNEYAPMKFYTLGIHGESGITLKIFEKSLPINFSVGPIVRYQSTSYPSIYSFHYNPAIFPEPVYTIKEIAPNTLSVGYKVQLALSVMKIRRSSIFFNSYFQNDTRGDVITGLGFVLKNLSY